MRLRRIAGITTVSIITLAAGLYVYLGRSNDSSIEKWINNYILGVVSSYINPIITWDKLDYQPPLTVAIVNLRLQSKGITILDAKRVTLGLTRLPQKGQPVQIERIEFTDAHFRFQKFQNEGFAGWSHFVRMEALGEGSVAPGNKLSDAFQMRRLTLQNTSIILQLDKNEPEMTLPGISFALDTPADSKGPGWYGIAAKLKREPLFDVSVKGRFNVDTARLELSPLELTAQLAQGQYEIFPPNVQQFLSEHALAGKLSATIRGASNVTDLATAHLDLTARLQDAHLALREKPFSITTVSVTAGLADGRWTLDTSAQTSEGSATLKAAMEPTPSTDITLTARVEQLNAATLLTLAGASDAVPLQTRVGGTLAGRFPREDWRGGQADMTLAINDVKFGIGSANLVTPRVEVKGHLKSRAATFNYGLAIFSGRINGDGRIGLDDPMPASIDWHIANADFSDIVRTFGGDAQKYAGRFQSDGSIAFDAATGRDHFRGTANASVKDGRLVDLPLVSGLLQVVGKQLVKLPFPKMKRSDYASINCQLGRTATQVDKFDLSCDWMAAHGSGSLTYAGDVNLVFNAGPLEKLEQILGPIGKLLGRASDRLMSYSVTGPLTNPRVEPRPLGVVLPSEKQ